MIAGDSLRYSHLWTGCELASWLAWCHIARRACRSRGCRSALLLPPCRCSVDRHLVGSFILLRTYG